MNDEILSQGKAREYLMQACYDLDSSFEANEVLKSHAALRDALSGLNIDYGELLTQCDAFENQNTALLAENAKLRALWHGPEEKPDAFRGGWTIQQNEDMNFGVPRLVYHYILPERFGPDVLKWAYTSDLVALAEIEASQSTKGANE